MSAFTDKIIQIVNMVPKGKVVSYGQVALMAGVPRGARQVGWVLFNEGPNHKDELPWWRVINNGGKISIKNPRISADEQKRKLEAEGIPVTKDFQIDIEKYRWRPPQETLNKLKLDDEYTFTIMEKYGV